MTDDVLDAAVELRRQHLHNRQTLGFSYYETNRPKGGYDPAPTTGRRTYPSRAGQLNWRKRQPSAAWREDEASRMETLLAFAIAGCVLRYGPDPSSSAP